MALPTYNIAPMRTSKPVLVAAGTICFALVGYALYLQHVLEMLPCPLCVLQRYAFVAVGLLCFIFAALPRAATKAGALLAALAALVGAGIAGWHLWVKAHPTVSCGIDPLETSLNKIFTAELMPFLFKADHRFVHSAVVTDLVRHSGNPAGLGRAAPEPLKARVHSWVPNQIRRPPLFALLPARRSAHY
jgi:disulfide bond formation protein DsbB